jgi:hypothetical protein
MIEMNRLAVVIVLRPGSRTGTIRGWIRRLLPTALLLVSPVRLPPDLADDAIVLDEEEVASGPLSLADALLRHRSAPPGTPTG